LFRRRLQGDAEPFPARQGIRCGRYFRLSFAGATAGADRMAVPEYA